MNLLKSKLGQIKTLGLPPGRHEIKMEMKNGKVVGEDLPSVAAVERFIRQAESLPMGHLEGDGPETWYDSWIQKHDRNNWSRDLDEDRFRLSAPAV